MAKEEYKQLSCSDVGIACGFLVRANTEADLTKHAKTHAAEAHDLKEISQGTEKKIKAAIKQYQHMFQRRSKSLAVESFSLNTLKSFMRDKVENNVRKSLDCN